MSTEIAQKLSSFALVAASLFGAASLSFAETPKTENKRQSAVQPEVRPTVESQRKQESKKVESSIDQEATEVISQTQKALTAIQKKDKKEALAALERATGKANILIARNQKAALIPVDFEVEVADTAPVDPKAIKTIADASRDTLKDKHYGEARALLDTLRSEIRVRTFNLPLATYPAALIEAAKLVDQGKDKEATGLLVTALNTLVIVDKATSIPMLELTDTLKLADEEAQKTDEKEKAEAEAGKHLVIATTALKRAEALGHIDEKSAKDFQKQIDELERKIKGKEATASFFTKLRDSVGSFFNKQSGSEYKGTLTSKSDSQKINKR